MRLKNLTILVDVLIAASWDLHSPHLLQVLFTTGLSIILPWEQAINSLILRLRAVSWRCQSMWLNHFFTISKRRSLTRMILGESKARSRALFKLFLRVGTLWSVLVSSHFLGLSKSLASSLAWLSVWWGLLSLTEHAYWWSDVPEMTKSTLTRSSNTGASGPTISALFRPC